MLLIIFYHFTSNTGILDMFSMWFTMIPITVIFVEPKHRLSQLQLDHASVYILSWTNLTFQLYLIAIWMSFWWYMAPVSFTSLSCKIDFLVKYHQEVLQTIKWNKNLFLHWNRVFIHLPQNHWLINS